MVDHGRGRLLRPGAHPGGVRRERADHRRDRPAGDVQHQPARAARAGAVALGGLRGGAGVRPGQRGRGPDRRRPWAASCPVPSRPASCSAWWWARPWACSGPPPLAVRLGIGRLPGGTTWRHMLGLATAAGVGFTVALFVASLSFDTAAATDAAKVGILTGSTVSGVLGYLLLARRRPRPGPARRRGRRRTGRTAAAPTGCPWPCPTWCSRAPPALRRLLRARERWPGATGMRARSGGWGASPPT